MIKGGYYEKTLVNVWREVLLANYDDNNDDETIVLDVGGNIGFFSLLSMSLSKWMKQRLRVHTFEPNPLNIIRICESLQLNDWHHPLAEEYAKNQNASIMIHPIGISDKNDVMSFLAEDAQPGSGKFIRSNEGAKGGASNITVVRLDDFARQRGWLDISASSSSSRPNIAILKIDVEGLEPEVILGAKELIRSRVVRNIFMEVTVATDSQSEACAQALAVIVNARYQLKQTGGFLGPGNKNLWPNDEHLISKILDAARNQKVKQLNLWWAL
jgi:FkbM family methyltransferase